MNSTLRGNIYMLCILINELLATIILALLQPMLRNLPFDTIWLAIASQILCFLPPFLIYMKVSKKKFNEIVSFKALNSTNAWLIILLCFAIQPTMTLLSGVSMFFFENNVNDFMLKMYRAPLPLLLIAMAVAPAFFEELTLRGVVLKNYEHAPIKKAAFANGILFGIMHLDPQQFLYAFLVGIIFAYMAYYTQSIFASMLGHFTINATQCINGFIGYKALSDEEIQALLQAPTTQDILNSGIFIVVIAAIFLPVFVILFRSFINYNKRRIILDALHDTNELQAIEPPLSPKSAKMVNWAFILILIYYTLFILLV